MLQAFGPDPATAKGIECVHVCCDWTRMEASIDEYTHTQAHTCTQTHSKQHPSLSGTPQEIESNNGDQKELQFATSYFLVERTPFFFCLSLTFLSHILFLTPLTPLFSSSCLILTLLSCQFILNKNVIIEMHKSNLLVNNYWPTYPERY